MIDEPRIKNAIEEVIKGIGEDPTREGIKDTPQRVAEMYAELFEGMEKDPKADLEVGFELGHQEMVVLKDIPFYSMCEHHLLPFFGVAHVGYIPNSEGRIVGISKLARVVETIARRPQVQERMTTEIADAIFT
jgi:GTP cyclohydrolase I